MKIYLLDRNIDIIAAWKKFFWEDDELAIVHSDFDEFMNNHSVECVVSPANSFGLMDGGYDLAITRRFGDELQSNVQKYIIENFYGEQPVGTSFIIDTPKQGIKLIHTPTMRVPDIILDTGVVYQCMRTCLMTAYENDIKSIVIPAFGGRTGGVDADEVARMMWMAYNQIKNPPAEITWEYAEESHYRAI